MTITFEKLQTTHFPLLLKWLMTPHVRAWWDSNVQWTAELITQKYGQYVKGYKRLTLPTGIIEKPMHAYIILQDKKQIGYIQFYNKHDFPSEYGYENLGLPVNLAAIDWYIGEAAYLRKGIGTKALTLFVDEYVLKNFDAVFVDPDTANIAGIRTYEKAGFSHIKTIGDISWMLMSKN
ncbi:MAG: GNAT family N-acetyltransferase [Methylobacterium sp.]|nr:GNAT family N-acetyltransferase [Methylobacterium sp.]